MAPTRNVLTGDVAVSVSDAELDCLINKLRFHGTAPQIELGRRLYYLHRKAETPPELEVFWDEDSLTLLGTLSNAGEIDIEIPRCPSLQSPRDETARKHALMAAGIYVSPEYDAEHLHLQYAPVDDLPTDAARPLRDYITHYTVTRTDLTTLNAHDTQALLLDDPTTVRTREPFTIPVWEHPEYDDSDAAAMASLTPIQYRD